MNDNLIHLSPAYQKLHELILTIPTVSIDSWTVMHSLAYICFKYKEKFSMDYVFTYKDPPSKCYEYKLCSRLWGMLQAKACDGYKVKDYIDWFFSNYPSKPFRSIGALTRVESIHKFINYHKKQIAITMHTPLPESILSIASKFEEFIYIRTYGDLFYINKAALQSPNESMTEFLSLVREKFDLSILDNL